jgi:8-oxo-dGTP pyrophosphatase MutT (NUDIX family)
MPETLARIRQVLLPTPGVAPAIHEERCSERELTPAAVLFPIVQHPDELRVLLTQRTDHLRDHAGQISFPGGRIEDDDPSPVHAALREAEEEIGLARERVEVLGFLPEYRTGTGFSVQPVVALVMPPLELSLDAFEVAEAFEVPLSFILDPDNFQRHTLEVRGRLRQYFAVPYGERYIWGATAGMIASLLQLLGRPPLPLENPPTADLPC